MKTKGEADTRFSSLSPSDTKEELSTDGKALAWSNDRLDGCVKVIAYNKPIKLWELMVKTVILISAF